jgi:sensor domain CHASE-containing protein
MASRTGDWAFWDETYQLTTQGDASYHERNLNADSLKINDVDLMVFLSRTGEYVDGAHFSAEQHSTSPVSSVLLKELLSARGIGRQLNVLLHTPNPELKPVSGIVSLWGDPMLVALTPVTQSNMSSNVGGWMIWAKRIHLFFPERYKTVLVNDTRLINITPATLPQKILDALFIQKMNYADQLSDTQISVFSILPDINQQPAGNGSW